MANKAKIKEEMVIPVMLGKDSFGENIVMDFAKAPQIMVAGNDATKATTELKTMIESLSSHFSPEELRLVLFHPQKGVFDRYRGLPHLQTPVIHGPLKMITELRKTAIELDERYSLLQEAFVKDIREYNELKASSSAQLPYKILFIGELETLQTSRSWRRAEDYICHVAFLGRAVGIHIVMATHCPVSTIPGTIRNLFQPASLSAPDALKNK